jgi:hypothetical protein
MDVLITLTTAGADTGPFNLYSNVDSYTTAFATGVAKSALLAGYLSTVVPASTTYVRVKSTGRCTNYIDIFVVGSATTTTTTTNVPPTTTTTTTQVVTYYNVVLCGTSTPSVIRHNGPNNVTLGVVVQSSNGQCYTVSSVGTGPETVGTLLTQFNNCVTCQGAPPPTTTTTSSSTSTTTSTSTSTSTTSTSTTRPPTTTTTTTSLSCFIYNGQNNNLEPATIFWTNCNGTSGSEVVQPNAFSSSFCARQGSVTGFNFTIYTIEPCSVPAPTTTTTTTTQALVRVWNLYRSEGATNPACSTTPASLTIPYSVNYAPGVVFKASNGLCYTIAVDGFQVSAPTITLSEEFGTCTECTESAPTTTSTTTTSAPILYTQYTLCTDFNVKYYIVGTGVGSSATIAGLCYQIAGTTFTPQGTQFFTSSGACECP